jgi:hypothetical protein
MKITWIIPPTLVGAGKGGGECIFKVIPGDRNGLVRQSFGQLKKSLDMRS